MLRTVLTVKLFRSVLRGTIPSDAATCVEDGRTRAVATVRVSSVRKWVGASGSIAGVIVAGAIVLVPISLLWFRLLFGLRSTFCSGDVRTNGIQAQVPVREMFGFS